MYNYGCYLSYYYATDLSPKVLQQQYVDEVGKWMLEINSVYCGPNIMLQYQ